ncbi:MAG: hypothetical protein J1G06_09370 [Oscillospiraceae bacterium]|nr:hypothetical protein [Oscillospiraceae bacterium]
MRKFISLLSAASIAATSLVAVITAQAAGETVLYSDSFNGYETSQKTAEGTVFAAQAGNDYSSVAADPNWAWIFNSPASQTLDKLTVGFDGGRGDDTGTIMIVEKDESDKYLQMHTNRFQSRMKPQITGFDGYSANAGEDLVIAFDLLLNDGANGSAGTLDLGIGEISTATEGVTAGEWTKVRVVTSDGTTDVYVGENKVIGDASGVISTIRPKPFDADTKVDPGPYPEVSIDELVIMSVADGANAEIPEAGDNQQEEEATAAPFEGDPVVVDFDDNTLEAAGFTVSSHKDYATVSVAADTDADHGNVWKVVQTSEKNNSPSNATIDFSNVTAGKSHIGIEYDLKAGDGRVSVVVYDGLPSGNGDAKASVIKQGVFSSGAAICTIDEWVHTVIDVDLATGSGTYKVTGADDALVGQGRIETTVDAITAISLVSWYGNTSYLDNLVVKAGGEMEKVEITPEPASEVEGSNIDLLPEGATQFADFSAAEGTAEKVLNHSAAKPAVTEASVSIYNADANIRGKSVYASYDVLVNAGDALTLETYASDGTSLGSTFILEGNEDGTATVYGKGDKGDRVNISGNLVNGTWYRVLIEIPQGGTPESPTTGTATYTIYRINPEDPTAAIEVAAQGKIGPRNLSNKAAISLKTVVTGTPYIDNGVTFLASSGLSLVEEEVITPPPVNATPEPASTVEGSNVDLTPDVTITKSFDFSAVEGTAVKKENHSLAKPVQAADVSVYDADTNVRGKSIYALYDVYMNKGDDLKLEVRGSSDLGPTLALTGNEDGTVTVYGLGDKGDKVNIAGNLVYGTWYRVLIEIPQNSNEGNTNTGAAIYTIYRINPTDPTAVTEIAAQGTVGPRNLSGKGATKITAVVTGTPYVDNGVAFIAANGLSLIEDVWTKYTPVYNEDGTLKSVTIEAFDPATGTIGEGELVWNQFMKPYVAE